MPSCGIKLPFVLYGIAALAAVLVGAFVLKYNRIDRTAAVDRMAASVSAMDSTASITSAPPPSASVAPAAFAPESERSEALVPTRTAEAPTPALNVAHEHTAEQISNADALAITEAQRQERLKDPRFYYSPSGVRRSDKLPIELFGPDNLPDLRSMLGDPEFQTYWGDIARTVGAIAEPGDRESLMAIRDYLTRPTAFAGLAEQDARNDVTGRLTALHAIGAIADQEGREFLRRTSTPEGAAEVGKGWIEFVPKTGRMGSYADPATLTGIVRSAAGRGTAYAEDADGMRLLEEFWRAEYDKAVATGQSSRVMSHLLSAMATSAYVQEHGPGSGWTLFRMSTYNKNRAISPYLSRFRPPR